MAQNCELECTKVLLPQVKARGLYSDTNVWHLYFSAKLTGLNIVEVAHDMQQQVARYVTSGL